MKTRSLVLSLVIATTVSILAFACGGMPSAPSVGLPEAGMPSAPSTPGAPTTPSAPGTGSAAPSSSAK